MGSDDLAFRGGPGFSAVPMVVFIAGTIVLVVRGAPVVEGMIVVAMLAISAGMVFARNPGAYSEQIFSLMANRTATVAVVTWLWAGAFAGILADSGLVEAVVWLAGQASLEGAVFTAAVFFTASLFAVSVGTGLGTVVGFTAVMYPAGVVLGANPAAVMGAIFSGAAFGDNLAPVSDTTIVSAATQEADVGGVVRSRLKYSLPAGLLALALFLIFGGGSSSLPHAEAERLLARTADPTGLPMLIPAAIVFVIAVGGGHFLVALTAGIAAAIVTGPISGAFPVDRVFHVTEEGSVVGSAVDGAMALTPISILTLLLITSIGIMGAGGLLTSLLDWLDRAIGTSRRRAEAAIAGLVSLTNLCVSVNTVAMVTAGPVANDLRKRHGMSRYRSANLLDTISCSFPFMLPYAATIVAATAIQQDLVRSYDFLRVTPWLEEVGYIFYPIVLFFVVVFAIVTGYGREPLEPAGVGESGGPSS